MKVLKTLILGAVVIAVNLSTASAADRYTIHEDHTWVNFTINHAGWANAHGKFKKVSGDIHFDKQDITKSKVSVTIDARSLDTNSEQRDRDMAGQDFINSIEFPKITFNSERIEKTGEKTFLVHGKMFMAGVSRDVVLNAKWNNEMPLPWDPNTIKTGFSATTTIDGVDFGMKKLLDFGIGPKVHVQIDAEAIKQ